MRPREQLSPPEYLRHILRQETGASQRNRARLETLLHFAQRGRLLEIGCGRGGFLRLARHYFTVEGIDRSPAAARACASHGLAIRQEDLDTAAIDPAAYHVIAAYNILEHLPDPLHTLRRLRAALQTGGLLIGSVPNNHGAIGKTHTRLTNLFDRTHVSTYPTERWLAIFQTAGFRPRRLYGELLLGPRRSIPVLGPRWMDRSFNFMFVWEKI